MYPKMVLSIMALVLLSVAMPASAQPVITVYSPEVSTEYSSYTVPLQVSANDTIDTWWYSLNSGANTTFTPNTTITAVEGSNSIVVYGNNTFGNYTAMSSVAFSAHVPTGMELQLTNAGSGLGNFLTAITSPVVDIVLALGIVGGILAVFYGIASAIRRAVGGATQQIGA